MEPVFKQTLWSRICCFIQWHDWQKLPQKHFSYTGYKACRNCGEIGTWELRGR